MEYNSKFIQVKSIDEYAQIDSNAAQLNLLFFYADWSGSSHILLESLRQQENQLLEKVDNVIIADYDTTKNLSQKFTVDSIPTMLLISNNKVFHQFNGLFSLDEIIKKINEVQHKIAHLKID